MSEKTSRRTNPVDDLASLKNYDPSNPAHASIISKAMQALFFCTDTMAMLLEKTGRRTQEQHKETFENLDNFHRGR